MKRVTYLVMLVKLAVVMSFQYQPLPIYQVTKESLTQNPLLRIHGGLEADMKQFKFMILILVIKGEEKSTCSSSLMSPRWVITAAHCLDFENIQPSDVILMGGKANLKSYVVEKFQNGFDQVISEEKFGVQERRASNIYLHPDYDREGYRDIALIKVRKPFVIGSTIQPIPLATERMELQKRCTILGWGITDKSNNSLSLNFVSDKKVSPARTKLDCHFRKDGPFICLVGSESGITFGDSGSPLVCDGKIWGIASHMLLDKGIQEEYYCEVHDVLPWIRQYSGGSSSRMIDSRKMLAWVGIALWLSTKI